MTIDDATAEQQESEHEVVSYRAECYRTTEEYQDYLNIMEAVERKNKAIVEGNMAMYHGYEVESDENCGDC